jgi:hypothetical protein
VDDFSWLKFRPLVTNLDEVQNRIGYRFETWSEFWFRIWIWILIRILIWIQNALASNPDSVPDVTIRGPDPDIINSHEPHGNQLSKALWIANSSCRHCPELPQFFYNKLGNCQACRLPLSKLSHLTLAAVLFNLLVTFVRPIFGYL